MGARRGRPHEGSTRDRSARARLRSCGGRAVQYSTAEAIAEIGDPRAIEPLKRAIAGKQPTRHVSALGALGRLGDTWAVGQLIEIMCTKTVEPLEGITKDEWLRLQQLEGWVRRGAAKELRKIGTPQALDGFIRFWRSPAWGGDELAEEAGAVVRDLADERVTEELLGLLGGQGGDWLVETFAKLGDPRAIEPLERRLASQRNLRASENLLRKSRGREVLRGSVSESLTHDTLLSLVAANGGPVLEKIPDAKMRCCICGRRFGEGSGFSAVGAAHTLHVETGALFCKEHAEAKDALSAADFTSCATCGFTYPASAARFMTTNCPECWSPLGSPS